MRNFNAATLLALICATLAVAVPSFPTLYDQRPLHRADSPLTSRWRLFSNYLIDSIWGLSRSDEKPCHHRGKGNAPERVPSSHTLAQYGEDLVLRFNVSSSEEAASLAEAADTLLLDIWEYSHNWVDLRISKSVIPSLLDLLPTSLHKSHIPLLREKELAQAIQETYPILHDPKHHRHDDQPLSQLSDRKAFSLAPGPANGAENNIFFSDYQPFSVIQPWMRLLASLFTTHVRHINIGLSYEGRNIPALRVGVHPTNSEDPDPPTRKTVVVVGGLHAREWISISTVNYVAYSLITAYGKSQSVTSLLEAFDFVFVPTLNPDGYVYSWETDRLWRKNRQRTNIRFCHGIDLDHAFGFEWDTTRNPCSEGYSGENPFEAIEAKRLADWSKNETENNNVEFVGFLDLHSYSQQILYPYSYSCRDPPPGLENLEELAIGLGKAIRMTHGHYYEVLPACEGNVLSSPKSPQRRLLPHIEAAGGSALDYFYHNLSTRFAYQIKLRDRGTYGFLLPKENILPTGKEILNSILYFGSFLTEVYDAKDGGSGPVPPMEKLVEENEDEDENETWIEVSEEDTEEGYDGWVVKNEDLEIFEPTHLSLRRRRR